MKVLVACERFGRVRDAFIKRGHDAISCDILPTHTFNTVKHYQGDVRDILNDGWDLMIAFPPCTHLAVSGARWFKEKQKEQKEALGFIKTLLEAPIYKIALENPIGVISTKIKKPNQVVQPWWFGHGETKAICLWLRNLFPLVPTNIVSGRENRIHRMSPTGNRGELRSITYQGLANAMAAQWG